jgi:formate hydrogenlyase subunit 4
VASAAAFFAPAHLLVIAAFVMIILAETGKIPVDNPSGDFELAMIDEAKSLEYSGRGAALVHWGGSMKLLVLVCVLLNVLVTPWGLAKSTKPLEVLAAIPLVSLKVLLFIVVLAVIDASLAKLRLFRIPDFLGAAFVTAFVALILHVFSW